MIDRPDNWFKARVVPNEGAASGWTIEDAVLVSAAGCVPAAVADEALYDYEEFWTAREIYWNPADPDAAGVRATMTGDELERMLGLLTSDRDNGWYVVMGDEVRHPEISRYVSPTSVMIVDCQLADPATGVFDADGRRQPGINEPVPDQRDISESTLVLEDGQWKVTSIAVLANVDCDFGPTEEFGIPIVGERA